MVFWIPIAKRYRVRDDNRTTLVPDVRDFELAALRSGELEEVVQYHEFPHVVNAAKLKELMMPIWDRLTLESLREVPKPPWEPMPKHHRLSVMNPFEEMTDGEHQ
jgi:hypothetical protein